MDPHFVVLRATMLFVSMLPFLYRYTHYRTRSSPRPTISWDSDMKLSLEFSFLYSIHTTVLVTYLHNLNVADLDNTKFSLMSASFDDIFCYILL